MTIYFMRDKFYYSLSIHCMDFTQGESIKRNEHGLSELYAAITQRVM